MIRAFAGLALVLLVSCDATSLRRQRTQAAMQQGFWPFDGLMAHFFSVAPEKTQLPKVAAKPKGPTLQSVKDEVILSRTFGKKTLALCQGASPDELGKCR